MTTNSPHRPRKNTASSDHEKKNVTLDVPECYTGCSFDKGDDDAKSLFEEHPEDNPDENKTPKARDSWVETSYLDELPKTAPVPSTAASTVPQINITPEEFDSKTQTKSFFESIPEEEPFSWEDDTGLEGIKLERTPSKSNSSINARDRKKPILFRIYKWYQRRSLFLRTLLYILTGTAVLILPGLISLLFYTSKFKNLMRDEGSADSNHFSASLQKTLNSRSKD